MGLMIGLVFGPPALPPGPGPVPHDGTGPQGPLLPADRGAPLPPPPDPDPGGRRQRQHRQAAAAADHRGRGDRRLRGRPRRRPGRRHPQRRACCSRSAPPWPATPCATGPATGRRPAATGVSAPSAAPGPTTPSDRGPGTRSACWSPAAPGSSAPRWSRAASTGAAGSLALVEPGGDTANLDGLDVDVVEGDLRDPATGRPPPWPAAAVVFHVAALYRFWAPDPAAFYDINVGGTRNVLEAARAHGCRRVVYTSTVGTLGLDGATTDAPVDERSFAHVDHLFGRYKQSKYVAEHEVLRAAAEGLPAVLVQPTTPVGTARPGAHPDRSDGARLPQRADPRLRRHHAQHRGRRGRGRRPPPRRRPRRTGAQLHPRGPQPPAARRARHPGGGHGAAGAHPTVPERPGPGRRARLGRWWRAGSCAGSRPSRSRGRGCRPRTCRSTTPGPGPSWATRRGPRPRRSSGRRAGSSSPERCAPTAPPRCTWPSAVV